MSKIKGTDFLIPPQEMNFSGQLRSVGMEFEFAGVDIPNVAKLLGDMFSGSIAKVNAFIYRIEDTAHGDFQVEIDSAFLKEKRYEEFLEALGLTELKGRSIDESLRGLSEIAVPMEVVTPPIGLDSLNVLEKLRDRLRSRKALGTNASLIYAFGLHINPEAASLDAPDVLNVLRAFLLLYAQIMQASDVDPTRKLTPYIDPFPERYVRKILEPEYQPSQDKFIDDYLADNPTRNRALDMLPILAHLDEQRVKLGANEPDLVRARPAFHYRLPNCRIDEGAWTVAEEWNRWVAVERLAADETKLKERSEAYLANDMSIGDWLKDLFR